MSALLYSVIFIFGLILGSFLNCFIYRLEIGGSALKGRSFCPGCKHVLAWSDLIPVISFFLLERKCRYCKKPISWQYPLVEIATGFLFFLSFYFSVNRPEEIVYRMVISCFLIVIFVYDLKHYLIPDKVVYPAIILSGFWLVLFGENIIGYFYSAVLAAGFFLFLVLISKGKWMGIGDIKLGFLMGLFLGWPGILAALFLAFFSGALVGLSFVFSGRKKISSEIPFGPFLVFGTFISLFLGEDIINWYLSFFLIK